MCQRYSDSLVLGGSVLYTPFDVSLNLCCVLDVSNTQPGLTS